MVQENRVVDPNFIVTEDGRVVCAKHTLFNKPREKPPALYPPILNLFANPQPPPLTCKTCGYYFNDSCYFAPQSVDQILYERDHGHIICDFCGDKITRSMSVLQKIYYENKFGVKMPLVCCTCYANLKDDNFLDKAWVRLLILFSIIGLSMIIILYNITFFLSLGIWTPSIIFTGFGIWFYLTFVYARKMFLIWKGQKNYSRLEEQFKKIET